jgi:hypothetical protein
MSVRGWGNAGGYGFKDSGDKQGGVWTEAERAAEAARIREQQDKARQEFLSKLLGIDKEQDNG